MVSYYSNGKELRHIYLRRSWRQNYPARVDNADPGIYGLVNKNLSASHGISPYQLMFRDVLEAPKTTQVIVIVLSFYHNQIASSYL